MVTILLPDKRSFFMDGYKEKVLSWAVKATKKHNTSVVIIYDGRSGMGKCEIKGDKVLMSDGSWRNVEDIKVGDSVISPQSNGSFIHAKVLETHNHFAKDTYDIYSRAEGKRLYSCSAEHLIPVSMTKSNRISGTEKRTYSRKIENRQAKNLFNHGGNGKSAKFSLFSTTPIEYDQPDCKIDPYSLGAFLGDGHYVNSSLGITSADIDIINQVCNYSPVMRISKVRLNNKARNYMFSFNSELARDLKYLGLFNKRSHDKFIPKEALLSHIPYRLKLLAGLIDTDGWIESFGAIRYCSKSKQLAEDVKDLVFSLGGRAEVRPIKKKCQTGVEGLYYNVRISFKNPSMIPLQVKRKKDRLSKSVAHDPRHITVRIEKGKPQQVYGFSIEGQSKWYITNDYLVTHNSTSAIQDGFYCDRSKSGFGLHKTYFNPDEFIQGLENAEPYSFHLFDEAMVLSNRATMSKLNQTIVKAMSMIRSKKIIVAFCINSIFDMDRNLALSRADILFHAYGRNLIDRGKFAAFFKGSDGQDRIKQLYLNGKKFYTYSKPKSNFIGRFSRRFLVDPHEYETKKQRGIIESIDDSKVGKAPKWTDELVYHLVSEKGISKEELAKICGLSVRSIERFYKSAQDKRIMNSL